MIALLFVLIHTTAAGQTDTVKDSKAASIERNDVYTTVEIMPKFPGGEAALLNYLSNNLKYPGEGIHGKVFITFIVEADGKISDVKILRGLDYGPVNEETLKVIKAMPDWIPGKQKGKNVAVRYTLPIQFH